MPISESQAQGIAEAKDRFIEYYEKVPVVRYAAQYARRNEDTAFRWIKEDTEFAERVQEAESRFIKEKMKNVKGEFALERLFKHVFAQRTEITGKDGGPVETVNYTDEQRLEAFKVWLRNNPQYKSEIKAVCDE